MNRLSVILVAMLAFGADASAKEEEDKLSFARSTVLYPARVCTNPDSAENIATLLHKKGTKAAWRVFFHDDSCRTGTLSIKVLKIVGIFGIYKVLEVSCYGEKYYLVTDMDIEGFTLI